MTEENSRRGLANKRAGDRAMYRAVTWLRDKGGCPSAERIPSPHRGDMSAMLTGVGDTILEVTVESWQGIGAKANQAAGDAAAMGYDRWCVWKPRRGVGDMGGAWCVTEFRQFWALVREVAKLRRLVAALAVVADPAKIQAAADAAADLDPQLAAALREFSADKLIRAMKAGPDA